MINNRQAGRRRGRNNPRQNGGGNRGNGGDSGNRIDNRARGNAAQLLEKYRNMARDAQLAGDRVNMEYYLQFADHYFRVLADNRARQEENQGHGQQQRFRRYDELDQDDEFGDDNDGFGDMGDEMRRDEPRREEGRRDEGRRDDFRREPREDNRRDDNRREEGRRDEGRREESRREPREPREDNRRGDRDTRRTPRPRAPEAEAPVAEPVEAARPSVIVEPANDIADTPPVEAVERPRRGRKPRAAAPAPDSNDEPGLDMSVLPPAIGRAPEGEEAAEAPPAPRRGRRPRTAPPQAAE